MTVENRQTPPLVDTSLEAPPIQAPPVVGQPRPDVAPAAAPTRRKRFADGDAAWLASLLVHAIGLLILAMLFTPAANRGQSLRITCLPDDASGTIEGSAGEFDVNPHVEAVLPSAMTALDASIPMEIPELDPAPADESTSARTALKPTVPKIVRRPTGAFASGGGLQGRSADRRGSLAKTEGGTPQSEDAVEMGLAWIVAHQRSSGGWRFDHRTSQCRGQCTHPGTVASTTGATALALLPLLGRGYTHREGPYQNEVDRALQYLTKRMLATSHGGDFQEGTMYAQGLSVIALCEAFAMTGDSRLRTFAQKGVDFIVYAQNSSDGGWRYAPGQPGDTTVLGWQLMALRSGRMAGLNVPRNAVYMAERFLDSVESEDGARYGYQSTEARLGTTAVGLLSRMYLGSGRDDPPIERGAEYLFKKGPSKSDMYFNYYAAQVLHHRGGEPWKKWNEQLRDHLVAAQEKSGHARGSWDFKDQHGKTAGRLYHTAMSTMILEVYYRYLPLYTERAVDGR